MLEFLKKATGEPPPETPEPAAVPVVDHGDARITLITQAGIEVTLASFEKTARFRVHVRELKNGNVLGAVDTLVGDGEPSVTLTTPTGDLRYGLVVYDGEPWVILHGQGGESGGAVNLRTIWNAMQANRTASADAPVGEEETDKKEAGK